MTPRDAALRVARRLRDAGHEALFAGGCVRDDLLGREPVDFDIATSARPDEVLRLFPGANEVGAHFGVVIVKTHGRTTEVATFRTDGSYRDSRRPESVEFSNAVEDAKRRDFTVNALFRDPQSGGIIDHVGGLADLQARVLRAVGDPQARFEEDALRLLRAARFAVTLDFALEPATHQAVKSQAHRLSRISPERIRDEFSRLLTAPRRAAGLDLLLETGLLAEIVPEALAMVGCEQPPEWHPEGDVYTHTRIMLDLLAPDAPLELCLAVLLHDIAKPPTQTWDEESARFRFNNHDRIGAEMAESILRRLRYPNAVVDCVVSLVARHMQFMNVQRMRTAKLKRFLADPHFDLELELHRVDCASSNGFTDNYDFLIAKRAEFAAEPLIPPPLVGGRDLIALGLSPGPRFKELLETIQTEQLEGRILTREDALAALAAEVARHPGTRP